VGLLGGPEGVLMSKRCPITWRDKERGIPSVEHGGERYQFNLNLIPGRDPMVFVDMCMNGKCSKRSQVMYGRWDESAGKFDPYFDHGFEEATDAQERKELRSAIVRHLRQQFCSTREQNPPDDHRGQVYNPITKKWSWF